MKHEIKIDHDIPAPVPIPANNKKVNTSRMPFHKLDIGDSFFYATDSFSFGAYHVAARLGIKIVTRKGTEKGRPGFRVWRVR